MSLTGGQNFAMYVVFKDDKKGVFYSRDRKSSKSKTKHPDIGFYRLLKLADKYKSSARNISIYDHRDGCPENGTLIWQWHMGEIKVNALAG